MTHVETEREERTVMIVINCIRIKRLLQEKGLSVDTLQDRFILRSHDTDLRLNQILHNSFYKDKMLDAFVYEIARELDVSVDYLYGWVEEPYRFIPQLSDSVAKQKEILRLLNKYVVEQGLERKNTNILAAETDLDREIFDYIYSSHTDWSHIITTSYYIIAKLSVRFDFNFYTVMNYLLDGEEYPEQEELVRYYSQIYEKEYGIKTI